MNPDTPSLELCKRLAKVWPAEAGPMGLWFWKEKDSPSWTAPLPLPMANLDRLDIIPAPTIGEMLDYIRQGGYAFAYRVAEALDLFPLGWGGLSPTGAGAQALLSMTADALAAALAAALAEAKERANPAEAQGGS